MILFGATGMLGQAIAVEGRRRGRAFSGVSRHGPDVVADLASFPSVRPLLAAAAPDLVINAAALADIDACERDPALALAVNARAVLAMAEYCRDAEIPFVQISSDHFFTGNGPMPHGELAPVALLNEYARSKYLGEGFAGIAPRALVVRTNVTGCRGWAGRPTFAEWAMDALERRAPLTLFDDFYSSTIDTPSFARALFDLIERGVTGTINLAAHSVASKWRFVHRLARMMEITLDWDEAASVQTLAVPRAESLGLDVRKAEALLGYALPDTDQVCRNLVSQRIKPRCAILPRLADRRARDRALDRPSYFIADIAANHDGDLARAKDLIWRAKAAGADAVKFQHFAAHKIVSDLGFRQLGGQIAHQAKWDKPVFEVYRQYSIDRGWDGTLVETAREAGIDWMTTPYDREATDAVADLLPAFKIGSGDITRIESDRACRVQGQAGAAGDRRCRAWPRSSRRSRRRCAAIRSFASSNATPTTPARSRTCATSICGCCRAMRCTGPACRSGSRTIRRGMRPCWAPSRWARASWKNISPTTRPALGPITPSR